MNGSNWCRQITGYLLIYKWLKPSRYHNWDIIIEKQICPCYNSSCSKKYSKFEKICGYNCSFIIEKGPFVKWIAATGGKLTLFLWKQRRLPVLISKKYSNFESTRSLQLASRNNGGTTQMYGSFEVKDISVKYIVYAQVLAASAVLK